MKNRRLRILYLMHVDWRWIKQRPHFLAESLAEAHDVLVLYRPSAAKRLQTHNPSGVMRLPLLPIPRRFGLWSEVLDATLQRLFIWVICWYFRPECVYLTFPTMYNYLPSSLRKIPSIYDCMDDAPSFSDDLAKARRIIAAEQRLVENAKITLCSSMKLRECLVERYGDKARYRVIRNAISEHFLLEGKFRPNPSDNSDSVFLDVAYVGTVSSWIDLESILLPQSGM